MEHFGFVVRSLAVTFFFPDEDSYMMTKAAESFRKSGNLPPICSAHQKHAKICMVKDKMKLNYCQPFFVCAEREDRCTFWQWGDIFHNPSRRCGHGLVCRIRKDGSNQNPLFCCCIRHNDACNFFEWKSEEDSPRISEWCFPTLYNISIK
jgi:hypothetical protein